VKFCLDKKDASEKKEGKADKDLKKLTNVFIQDSSKRKWPQDQEDQRCWVHMVQSIQMMDKGWEEESYGTSQDNGWVATASTSNSSK